MTDDHTTSDHGQVRGQAAGTAKAAQQRKIVFHDGQEEFRGQVLFVLLGQLNAAGIGRVVDDMHHQSQKTIDEVFPRVWMVVKAPLEQLSVYFKERMPEEQANG